jgi:hypothetical protein
MAAPASWITLSFYGAHAVLVTTWGRFTDLCQLPMAILLLPLGLERRSPWLMVPSALAIRLIREDTVPPQTAQHPGAGAQGRIDRWAGFSMAAGRLILRNSKVTMRPLHYLGAATPPR